MHGIKRKSKEPKELPLWKRQQLEAETTATTAAGHRSVVAGLGGFAAGELESMPGQRALSQRHAALDHRCPKVLRQRASRSAVCAPSTARDQ